MNISYQKQPRCDATTSSTGSCPRRIIFPTIHQKYTTPPTPIFYSSTTGTSISKNEFTRTSSIESDMPSLTSLSTVSDSTMVSFPSNSSDEDTCDNSYKTTPTITDDSRCSSRKAVRFDPRIWVHEFVRSETERKDLWFTVKDLNTFKFGALQCIMVYNSKVTETADHPDATQQWSTPTKKTGSVLFTHPALGIHNDYDDGETDYCTNSDVHRTNSPSVGTPTRSGTTTLVTQFREAVAENEIRNILVIDPKEICLKLYTKGLRRMFPHATIVTTRTKEEALQQVEQLSTKTKSGSDFDVIINDEPTKQGDVSLDPTLFMNISKSVNSPRLHVSVLTQRIYASKAIDTERRPETDLVWTKPPPLMNDELRDKMLKTLLIKRGRTEIAKKLFV